MLIKRSKLIVFAPAAFALALGSLGCGSDSPPETTSGKPLQCESASYVAFDAASFAEAAAQVDAFKELEETMDVAVDDPTMAQAKFMEAELLYQTKLSAAVKARTDEHLASKPSTGMELDATMMAAYAAGKQATDGTAAELSVETVEVSLLHFDFLAVHHGLLTGTKKGLDEAYAYLGSGAGNVEGMRKAFSELATVRDMTNGTGLEGEIFNALLNGSCELATALRDKNADSVDPMTVPALKAEIEKIDGGMQKVLAYMIGHEAEELDALQDMLAAMPGSAEIEEEMTIELHELDLFFKTLEPLMQAKGGDSAARATRMRTTINTATADTTKAWMQSMDAASVVTDVEAEFAIDVRG